ncbi:MAG: hypothetical protein VYA17_02645 [Pseudomonadota bacterium]|nr:hypothetical protein [Pseudomonadota bacterium]
MSLRERVAGVDFSGARDAGRHIWIAEGYWTAKGLQIDSIRKAMDLPGGSPNLTPALSALVAHILTLSDTVAGFDFPFSIPQKLIFDKTWLGFLSEFFTNHPSADTFRKFCQDLTNGREVKRETDIKSRAPWCVYNLRLYRQTWAGISSVLAPLILGGHARAIPMQKPENGLPILAEVCPASFLKKRNLYSSYKGNGKVSEKARSKIVSTLTSRCELADLRPSLRRIMVQDNCGDAIDSVIAAIAASAISNPSPVDVLNRIEGRVYF